MPTLRLKEVRRMDNGELYGYRFDCPGCDGPHVVGVGWTFNEDFERPTFSPSILVTSPGGYRPRCHSFVKDGRIRFLGDCEHELAGQTVELPEVSEWD